MDNIARTTKYQTLIQTKPLGSCNCRKKEDCPIPGKYTASSNAVYEAQVPTSSDKKAYIGLTSTSFKTRYATQKSSITNRNKRHQTELSKYIWKLKDEATPYSLKWRIVRHAQPYSPKTNRCNLCLWEKYHIITAKKTAILNLRTELISTCKHKKKFFLSGYG